MPSALGEIALLELRVESLEERLDSTRQRFDEHAAAQGVRDGEMTRSLAAIQMDVHDIRAGKRAMLWLARVILAVVVTTGAGLIVTARWAVDHYLRDLQLRDDPAQHRSIP